MNQPITVCIGIAIASLIVLVAAIAINAAGPSCAERGGVRAFSHYAPIYQPALKTMQLVPQYKCQLPKGKS